MNAEWHDVRSDVYSKRGQIFWAKISQICVFMGKLSRCLTFNNSIIQSSCIYINKYLGKNFCGTLENCEK